MGLSGPCSAPEVLEIVNDTEVRRLTEPNTTKLTEKKAVPEGYGPLTRLKRRLAGNSMPG